MDVEVDNDDDVSIVMAVHDHVHHEDNRILRHFQQHTFDRRRLEHQPQWKGSQKTCLRVEPVCMVLDLAPRRVQFRHLGRCLQQSW